MSETMNASSYLKIIYLHVIYYLMTLPFQIPSYVVCDTHHFLWTFTNPPSISQVIKMINWSWHKYHSKFIHSVGNTSLLLPVCLGVMGILQAQLFSWKASNHCKVLSSTTVHFFYFQSFDFFTLIPNLLHKWGYWYHIWEAGLSALAKQYTK